MNKNMLYLVIGLLSAVILLGAVSGPDHERTRFQFYRHEYSEADNTKHVDLFKIDTSTGIVWQYQTATDMKDLTHSYWREVYTTGTNLTTEKYLQWVDEQWEDVDYE